MVIGTAAGMRAGASPRELLDANLIEIGILALMISLAVVKKRWWHALCFAVLASGPIGWLSRTLG